MFLQTCWQVPALELDVGDLVLVDNQPESLTHKSVDEEMFEVSWLFGEILKMDWFVPLLQGI